MCVFFFFKVFFLSRETCLTSAFFVPGLEPLGGGGNLGAGGTMWSLESPEPFKRVLAIFGQGDFTSIC